ncbi:MAG: polymer-forming cytoskeletal protein [Bacteroidales bacterium]|jgi:cytoskeletal protein CcmA (bactofilin family)|nr:polymer-forming cytoskeletal protein [Bacteroidales bacterium]
MNYISKPTTQVDANNVSHISSGTAIKGEISSVADIRVDGNVQGKVYSKGRVVVGEEASLTGTLACENVDFWGKIEGDVYVKDTFSLKSTAAVNGNIHVRRIQVEMGAQINGTCNMISEEDYDTFVKDVITTEAPEVE